jgi:hypothetical protein
MNTLSGFFYVFMFWFCIGLFLFNYSSFSFAEKIIIWMLIAGFQCLAVIFKSYIKKE